MSFPFISQTSKNDCALACLAMLHKFHYQEDNIFWKLKQESNYLLTDNGLNLADIKKLSNIYDFSFNAYHASFNELQKLVIKHPVILQVKNHQGESHFVVCYRKVKNRYLIADPTTDDVIWHDASDFSSSFMGVIISLEPTKDRIKGSNTLKTILVLLNKYILKLLLIWLQNLIILLLFFIAQLMYKQIIDNLLVQNYWEIIILFLLSYFLINLIHLLSSLITDYSVHHFYFLFRRKLIERYHQHWFSLPVQVSEQFSSGYHLNIYQDIANISTFFINHCLEILTNTIMLLLASFFLLNVHWSIFLLVMTSGIINFCLNYYFMCWQKPLINKQNYQKIKLNQQIIISNNNFSDSHYRQLLPYLANCLEKEYVSSETKEISITKRKLWTQIFNGGIKHIIHLSTLLIISLMIHRNQIVFSQLIFITTINVYIFAFFNNISELCFFWPELVKSYQRYTGFLQLPILNKDNAKLLVEQIDNIQITNLTFYFGSKKLLKNFNLELSGHNMLIGPNGIGKTSLMLLLAGKYTGFKGKILFAYNEGKKQNLEWNNTMIYITANSQIFPGTIIDNLFYFNETNEKLNIFEEIKGEEWLSKVGLKGTDMCLSEGINLSHGQRQLIIFLSIFFHNWKLILLDEVLSNLDKNLKHNLIKLLLSWFSQAIIVYASHDLTLSPLFSKIIDMERY